jgi:hypothetical protein
MKNKIVQQQNLFIKANHKKTPGYL